MKRERKRGGEGSMIFVSNYELIGEKQMLEPGRASRNGQRGRAMTGKGF